MSVPTASSLSEIYPSDAVERQRRRWNTLIQQFESRYGRKATFVSRSPGRVNIIGEHVDYSLYGVLPMAVVEDVLLAVTIRSGNDDNNREVRISNVNPKYKPQSFSIPPEGDVEIDRSSHDWVSYFKAGLSGASGLLRKIRGQFVSVGMDVMMDGSIPSGSGLSSSAAFVCAGALAVLKANGEETVDKKELVELAIVCERAVGVNSGGMDQAASVLPVRGSAIYVTFKPSLNARPIHFPKTDPQLTFLISQSFVVADKAVTGPIHYNLRVVEDTLAALFLSKILNVRKPLPEDAGPLGVSLRGFHDAFFEQKNGVEDNTQVSQHEFQSQLDELIQLTEDYVVQEDGYTREQLSEILDVSIADLERRFMTRFPVQAEKFKLRQRALHVFNEAKRVGQFLALLESADQSAGQDLLRQLGDLMNETQDSCREVYECSCPELDELCTIARKAGAYGSRLTGAGWGGCAVHLVPKNKVENVIEAWKREYYNKRWPAMSEEELRSAIVVSEPEVGSLVVYVDGDF
jgi:galactokinase